jgi:predicted membrane-bound mannosyltransferase
MITHVPLIAWLLIGAVALILLVSWQWIFVSLLLRAVATRRSRPHKPSAAETLAVELKAAEKRLLHPSDD